MKNLILNKGIVLTVAAAGAAIAGGDLVKVGDLVGVAVTDIKDGESGSVTLQGVYECPKAAGFSAAQGSKLYYDAANKNLVGAASGNTLAGYAYEAAGSADTFVQVKLIY